MNRDEHIELAPPNGWIDTGVPRLLPLQPHETGLGMRLLVTLVNKIGRLDAENLFMMLMRNFRLFRSWLPFAAKLMPFGEIARRETELIILRVAWNCRSRYEWGQHVDIGMRIGLTIDDIKRITHGAEANGWTTNEKTLIQACDEFHHDRMISDMTWQKLTNIYSHRQLLEVLMVIGHYEMLAGVLNSTGLKLDAKLGKNLEKIKVDISQ